MAWIDKTLIAKDAKKDIAEACGSSHFEPSDQSYQLLDDGTLIVHIYNKYGAIGTSYVLNISVGREMEKSEWLV